MFGRFKRLDGELVWLTSKNQIFVHPENKL
jgi:hypothetical protein